MARVGELGKVFDGFPQVAGSGGGSPRDTTQRRGLRHIVGESFMSRTREDPIEVVANDPFELLERVVNGSAAFGPPIAEGAEPVGRRLLAELSANGTDDHATDGDAKEDPSARIPAVDKRGGKEYAAAADA